MKIAFITDLHYGIRSDHVALLDNHKKFMDEVFFPTLDEERIDTAICLGDLIDRRKYINWYTAHRMRKDFLDKLKYNRIHMHWILGNHDIFWRENMDVSVATELDLPGTYYTTASHVMLDSTKILFVPWICDANREATAKLIAESDAKICLGHLEIQGFEMFKGIMNHDGETPDVYEKFDITCSGHFHHKSFCNGIHYLGACGEYTWSDCNDERGFHIFDTEDLSLRFIPNPFRMFRKFFYDDANSQSVEPDFDDARGKFIKVIVKSRTDSDRYNDYMIKLEKAQPLELGVVDDHLNLDLVTDDSIVTDTKDTLTIIRDYVAQSNNIINAPQLDKLIVKLYQEAQSIR
jgi:DNA repair exonuclease SbcCD nuclease subunit